MGLRALGLYAVVLCVVVAAVNGCATAYSAPGVRVMADCPTHGDSVSPVAEQELRDEWEKRFAPLPARSPHWTWNVWAPDEQDRLCLASLYAGCTVWLDGCPMTITTQTYASDCGLAAHEFAHYALRASGLPTDSAHANPAIWGADGFVQHFRALCASRSQQP